MNKQKIIFATVALVAANVLIGVFFFVKSAPDVSEANIGNAQRVMASLRGKPVYYTEAAKSELKVHRSEALAAADDEKSYFSAAQNPALFRQLDHRLHFDSLLLAGDPGAFRPLLRHLLETRDWTVVFVDQAHIVWQRPPATRWTPAMIEPMKAELSGKNRAAFLIGVANKLLALGQARDAKALLDEALALVPKSAEGQTQLALYHVQIGQWPEALAACDRALSARKNYPAALAAKAQIFFGAKRYDEALAVSQKAVDTNPRDPAVLFLDAKIAHEAHAFQREIRSLETLIDLAVAQGAPVSGYRIYLAQAYAADSRAQPAIEEFQKAAAAGDLTREQRAFVEESIARIKSRTGS